MSDVDKKKQPTPISFLKGFLAGVLVSHISKRFILGLLAGTLTGVYAEQNFQEVPNAKEKIQSSIAFVQEVFKTKK